MVVNVLTAVEIYKWKWICSAEHTRRYAYMSKLTYGDFDTELTLCWEYRNAGITVVVL